MSALFQPAIVIEQCAELDNRVVMAVDPKIAAFICHLLGSCSSSAMHGTSELFWLLESIPKCSKILDRFTELDMFNVLKGDDGTVFQYDKWLVENGFGGSV